MFKTAAHIPHLRSHREPLRWSRFRLARGFLHRIAVHSDRVPPIGPAPTPLSPVFRRSPGVRWSRPRYRPGPGPLPPHSIS